MTDKILSIVIPAFKELEKIKFCLQSLERSSCQNFRTILVDHGKNDDITRWIEHEYPDVICLRGSSDLWWSGATNIGIKYAVKNNSNLIMLLNHDCYVREHTIRDLLSSIDGEINRIVAPVQFDILTRKDLVCANSLFLLGFTTVVLPASLCRVFSTNQQIRTGLIIGGRGAIIHKEIFSSVGLFDEKNLPHYGADHDFYLRCKKYGIKLYTCSSAVIEVDSRKKYTAHEKEEDNKVSFLKSLQDKSSHRNLHDTWFLFSRYYPIPGLAIIGMILYLLRYMVVFFICNILHIPEKRITK